MPREATLNFSGNITFANNSADCYSGGNIAVYQTLMNFNGNSIFRNNFAAVASRGIYARSSSLSLDSVGKCSKDDDLCTSIFMKKSALIH